jgi:AbrB family looped-hinge helix DNA binding protein
MIALVPPRHREWYGDDMTWVVIGDKGRIVIPAAVRADAGVDIGDDLIARAASEGQIVLETRAVVVRRIRAQFADGEGTDGLRRSRATDLELEGARTVERAAERDIAAEQRRGDEILRELGVAHHQTKAS